MSCARSAEALPCKDLAASVSVPLDEKLFPKINCFWNTQISDAARLPIFVAHGLDKSLRHTMFLFNAPRHSLV